MRTIIQTPTPNLADSLLFYQQLQFKVLSDTSVTDGKIQIDINPDRFARLAIKLYQKDWSVLHNKLAKEKDFIVISTKEGQLLSDPNGVLVYLVAAEIPPPLNTTKALTGNFAGISIETVAVKKTILFWESLGYELSCGSEAQGWMTFSNGSGVDVSIMKIGACPHLFFNPSLTYFNGQENLALIQKIKAANISITEEITHFNKAGIVDNIIIRDPGGLGFFIFND